MLQNNHRDLSKSGAWALGTQWIQSNHRDLSNSGACALDAQKCPQVTLGNWEPIKDSEIFYTYIHLILTD